MSIYIPKFLLHKKDKLKPTRRGARNASNYPFYGIVYDNNTTPWVMEQEKAEYYLWTFLILVGILPAIICQIPYLRAKIEIWSHAIEGRAYPYNKKRWIISEARTMKKGYKYFKNWSIQQIELELYKRIIEVQ